MDEAESAICCTCTVKVTGKTGVEMEALTGASIALLTIYDMCKAMDRSMEIGEIYLVKKTGGKSGEVHNDLHPRGDSETGCHKGGRTELDIL